MVKKKGEKYKCEECGLVVIVEDDCGCEECDIVCCNTPMRQINEEKAKVEQCYKISFHWVFYARVVYFKSRFKLEGHSLVPLPSSILIVLSRLNLLNQLFLGRAMLAGDLFFSGSGFCLLGQGMAALLFR